MVKKPKGFGQPIQSNLKKTANKTRSQQTPLFLTPLNDTELLETKEARLKLIFSPNHRIPLVSKTSLITYHQVIDSHLTPPAVLISEEPFAWEEPYIYGRGSAQAHQTQRRQYPSYLDRFQLVSLSKTIRLDYGLQVEVQRLDETDKTYTIPLSQFKHDTVESSPLTIAIADYRFWWRNYQPTFP